MMYNILLFISAQRIILPVLHYYWIQVRVLRLRQEIYHKRDFLFDEALRLNGFCDPAYREAREHFNDLAWIAEDVSLPLILAFWKWNTAPQSKRLVAQCSEMQAVIDEVYMWSANRIYRYLYYETGYGWLMCLLSLLRQSKKNSHSKKQIDSSKVEFFVCSEVPAELSELKNRRLGIPSTPQAA